MMYSLKCLVTVDDDLGLSERIARNCAFLATIYVYDPVLAKTTNSTVGDGRCYLRGLMQLLLFFESNDESTLTSDPINLQCALWQDWWYEKLLPSIQNVSF